jgi:hypothetical protein
MKITVFLNVKPCHWQRPAAVNLRVFSFSPIDRLVASSTVRIHYTSCQSDENRTHVPLFNIHTLSEWRQLSFWNLDEGLGLRNVLRQIRLNELFRRSLALVWKIPATTDFVVLKAWQRIKRGTFIFYASVLLTKNVFGGWLSSSESSSVGYVR